MSCTPVLIENTVSSPCFQALLSAHDTVAQKDYEPVLPPMPEDLPDDEEATRIVCLVKNKQPLVSYTPKVLDLFKKMF